MIVKKRKEEKKREEKKEKQKKKTKKDKIADCNEQSGFVSG